MSTPMISWVPIAEFLATQAMEEAYVRYADALRAHDIPAFAALMTEDYCCLTQDGEVQTRKQSVEQIASLFDCELGSIELCTRIVSVEERGNEIYVRAAKELVLSGTPVGIEDVVERWRIETGRWLLAETRLCSG